ncbi:MAG: hypothetical protein AAB511_01380 [Patescibacteria group bacterium]
MKTKPRSSQKAPTATVPVIMALGRSVSKASVWALIVDGHSSLIPGHDLRRFGKRVRLGLKPKSKKLLRVAAVVHGNNWEKVFPVHTTALLSELRGQVAGLSPTASIIGFWRVPKHLKRVTTCYTIGVLSVLPLSHGWPNPSKAKPG